ETEDKPDDATHRAQVEALPRCPGREPGEERPNPKPQHDRRRGVRFSDHDPGQGYDQIEEKLAHAMAPSRVVFQTLSRTSLAGPLPEARRTSRWCRPVALSAPQGFRGAARRSGSGTWRKSETCLWTRLEKG